MLIFLKKNIHFFLIPIVSTIIIFSWFSEGKLISNNSEEDLNIYHAQKSAEYYSNFWYPAGTGQKTPFHMVRYPTFFVLGTLEQIGMPAFLIQAAFLWTLMIIGISTMYLLLRKIFNMTWQISLIGSFFYLLNIFSMTQVWKRFLYHGIFAWSYLPLFLFLWIKWIDTGKNLWLLFFVFTSLFFSYTFSQPAHLITIWVPAGIFVLIKLWQSRSKKKELAATILLSIIGFLLWCLINIWWFYPTLTLGSSWVAQTGQTWQSDLSSLQAVSKSFPIWEVILLRQSWYLSPENDFASFYQQPIIILISIITLLFVTLAIIKRQGLPHKGFLFTLSLVGLFISKGTNFPFGYIFFYLLFSNFPLTTALRNSYEKFGLVWLVAYTILFAFGFSRFLSLLTSPKRYLYGGIMLFLILGLLVLPIWTGSLFPQKHRLYVPDYYKEANNYLKQQSSSRVFHTPFLLDLEKVTYAWGYVGQDPSQNLFYPESITTPKIPFFYRFIEILPKFLNEKNFPKILGFWSVENVILHKDSIYPKINVEETSKTIEGWEGIYNRKEFGDLIVYSLNKQLIKPRIYAASSLVTVQSVEEGIKEILSGEINFDNSAFVEGTNPVTIISYQSPSKISLKKISHDNYEADVKNATEPFVLILNDTYDNLWQGKIGDKILEKHFMVNGFANGWLIEDSGDFKIKIFLKIWPWQ